MKVNIVQIGPFEKARIEGSIFYPSIIANAIVKQGVEVELSMLTQWQEKLQDPKFKAQPGELIHFRCLAPREPVNALADRGFICVNGAEASYNARDKLYSQKLAQSNNIPIAPTHPDLIAGNDPDALKKLALIMDQNDWPSIVIKPCFSSGNGANVWKLDRSEVETFDIRRLARVPWWVVQKCISYNRMIRAILHGGQLVRECVTYDSPLPGGWKCTVCINPHMAHEKNPSDELVSFVENICRVIKADNPGIAYIDVFETNDGYVYGETNVNCVLEQHEQVTGFRIHQHKANYLVGLLKNG
jgi:glutathione synthase/RimK-type ligase-like ATP-grasp enzyme